jgi:hypothetical protein
MNTKFKIFKHRQSENLYLKLTGEFNDMSVCELIDVLKDNYNDVMQVFVHTNNLNGISTSNMGRDVFNQNIKNLNDNSFNIQFIDGFESQLSV